MTVIPLGGVSYLMLDGQDGGERPTQDTAAFVVLKSAAISVTHSETVKKSNASQVQPRKPMMNMSHWCKVNSPRTAKGLLSLIYSAC